MNACNSRCRTCFIWRLYEEKPELRDEELTEDEFDRTFQSLGKAAFWITFSGGEPFLRSGLSRICACAIERCKPAVVNIPTNGSMPRLIEEETERILQSCEQNSTRLVVNLSVDGIGEEHDKIRGIHEGYQKLLDTYQRLNELRRKSSYLRIGVHSVVSRYNIDRLMDVYEEVRHLEVDSYITEIAEERVELLNVGSQIAPRVELYRDYINELSSRILRDAKYRRRLSRVTQALRLVYYQMAYRTVLERKQPVPCYAGYASCQITPYGDVWPCCILGHRMGNLRDANYDFKKVWRSREAEVVRESIRSRSCYCPLANAAYTNILCNFTKLLQVACLILKLKS